MTRSAILAEDAERDIEQADLWYLTEGGGELASRFLAAVRARLARLERFPEIHPTVLPGLRRAPTTPFPYLLLYEVRERAIVVHRCIHAHRDPTQWRVIRR